MVKVAKMILEKHLDNGGRLVRVDLLADTSLEVEDLGKSGRGVLGLNDTDEMAMGSTCFTADSELGVLNSAGNWNFQ